MSANLPSSFMSTIEELRKLSRQAYLSKREEAKLVVLKEDVLSYQSDIERNGLDSLSNSQREDFNYKKDLLQIVQERKDLSNQLAAQLSSTYYLPEDYTENVGEKKKRLLNAKSDDLEAKRHKVLDDKFEYNYQDQLTLNLPGSENYEYVFDDAHNIQFTNHADELEDEDQIIEVEVAKQKLAAKKRVDISEVRKSLPVYKYRAEILEAIEKHQVLILVGETGSGKTTQVPQYLYEAGYCKNNKKIACTQPRRVAATSVAARVAEEMGVKLGTEVGYSIRFDDVTSSKTAIKYVTDGMLLREFLTDPELETYSAIIVDEAHERTISTDIVLGLLKDILKINPQLKLIISSATVNAEKFSEFFNNAPVFNVPGRRYPVDIYYTQQPESNYIYAAITTILQIHVSQKLPGDILVFLTGQEEIESVEENLKDTCNKLGSNIKPLIIAPIYANMPMELQAKIFAPTPENSRKVVLATNIAETSITIDGIRFVIDPGFAKEKAFNPATGMESLVITPCSKASAQQRAGRAGRVGPGKCFRLYTKWSYENELPAQPTAEILRTNLSSVILLLLSLGIFDILHFEFLDKPGTNILIKSLELLYSLGALNEKGELTKLGKSMSEFPIEPMLSKCLISSKIDYSCLEEVLSIVSMLSESSSLFFYPKNQKDLADKCKQGFAKRYKDQGDHFLYLNIWDQWADNGYSYQWCQDNFLQHKTLNRIRNIREQLSNLCGKSEILLESNEKQDDASQDEAEEDKVLNIKKSICAGFFANSAKLNKSGMSFNIMKRKQEVFIHPSSTLFKQKPPPKLIIYNELVLTTKEYIRNGIVINEKILKELAPHYFKDKDAIKA